MSHFNINPQGLQFRGQFYTTYTSKSPDFNITEITTAKIKESSLTVRSLKNIGKISFRVTKYLISLTIQKIIEIVRYVLGLRMRTDSNKLIKTDYPLKESQKAWSLNWALLKDSYENAKDEGTKAQIRFLMANYLNKAAPIYLNIMKPLMLDVEHQFQINPEVFSPYHRYGFLEHKCERDIVFIPTDTIEFTELLPLNFTIHNDTNIKDGLVKTLLFHIEQSESPQEVLKKSLDKSILIDLTHSDLDLKEIKAKLGREIAQAVREIKTKCPQIGSKSLNRFIKKNLTTIKRVDKSERTGIEVLPIFFSLKGKKLGNVHHNFGQFLANTALFIGAVNMRRKILSQVESKKNVRYAVKGSLDAIYFTTPSDFSNLSLIKRLGNSKAHFLSRATVELIKGILENIQDDQIFKSELFQTTLVKLQQNLATAELWMHSDFLKFTQAMELAHSEIAALLEIAKPFEKEDFSQIYAKQLSSVPSHLKQYVRAGLGKTGMNLFAGINAAVLQQTDHPVRAYGKETYFENALFIGEGHTLSSILKDSSIRQVDLYTTMFNSNIEVASSHTHYRVAPIEDEIRQILKEKRETQYLTVAIDSTIDYINSDKVKNLLSSFSKEIIGGKINFVFFRSGQKLDMFGMDNYYGAPFYMVNNGATHWKPFDHLASGEAYQTDNLSKQWFVLANKYASGYMDAYRHVIFENTRQILNNVPKRLLPGYQPKKGKQTVRVNTISKNMEPAFIDIKVSGKIHKIKAGLILAELYRRFEEKGFKIHSRASFGFMHPNPILICINEVKGSSSIRINPGINPEENKVIIEFLESLPETF